MREYNALKRYPEPKEQRYVSPRIRTIKSRIFASYRDKEYYDGDRKNGYGGFEYDGRWISIAKDMYSEYNLRDDSAILQLGCEKGFLLHDFHQLYPRLKVRGIEISDYAITNAMEDIKPFIQKNPFTELSFRENEFDLVIAIGVVYTLNLADAIKCIKEIERVSKGKSFITLGSYTTEEEKKLFEWWTILGCTILNEDEWVEVLNHAQYTGDYKFMNARSLKLVEKIG
tara:strand:- start:252 stop:935 length:684 start_codon:yes stop_codon:yes gene_type:complete